MSSSIKIVSTVDAVVSSMSELIYRLDFAPGAQITEAELTERFGVSRNTIRESIARLIVNGLVQKQANHSLCVKKITPDDVVDIFETRAALELDAVKRICAQDKPIDGVREILKKVEHNKWQDNWYESVETDMEFHTSIISASGSDRLMHLYMTLSPEIKLCIYQAKPTLLPDPENKTKHREIVAALSKHDLPEASELVASHLRNGCSNVLGGFGK